MFIFFEYTAIAALTALVAALLFAVSAALLMVDEGLAAALRLSRRTANTTDTFNYASALQSREAQRSASPES